MAKAKKPRASKQSYQSPNQLKLLGFETPFEKNLNPENRWVVLAHQIPWDSIVNVYNAQLNNHRSGASSLNARVVIGSLIIKHRCNFSDRETIQNIQENVYMQYFLGYSSFSNEAPFDASLFVEIRKRLGREQLEKINDKILGLHHAAADGKAAALKSNDNDKGEKLSPNKDSIVASTPTNKGKLITDATACPQDIAYPTDLNLLNDARVQSEFIIDELYHLSNLDKKPRTYREIARKEYLQTAQKKRKSQKVIRKALRSQLSYVGRNLKIINNLLDSYSKIPLSQKSYRYLLVIKTLYDQQQYMYDNKVHRVDHRIVSIHQPHVRPIVRGKANSNVEFGAKIQVSLMQGYAFLDELSWDAFNEGTRLMCTVEKYKKRFGYYPKEVLVDKIYCNRANRKSLKQLGIKLRAKPLGRPKKGETYEVTAGERNPIEGKFGQAKTAYGLNRIKARLQQTSESWIATIIMVLNLVQLTKEASLYLFFTKLSLSVKCEIREFMKLKIRDIHQLILKLSNQHYLMLKLLSF
jgi:hypothetical protein